MEVKHTVAVLGDHPPFAPGTSSVAFYIARVEPREGASGRGRGGGVRAAPVSWERADARPANPPNMAEMPSESLQRGRREDSSEGVGISLLCDGGKNKASRAGAALVAHKPSVPGFWGRNPLCHSSALLGVR